MEADERSDIPNPRLGRFDDECPSCDRDTLIADFNGSGELVAVACCAGDCGFYYHYGE